MTTAPKPPPLPPNSGISNGSMPPPPPPPLPGMVPRPPPFNLGKSFLNSFIQGLLTLKFRKHYVFTLNFKLL